MLLVQKHIGEHRLHEVDEGTPYDASYAPISQAAFDPPGRD